MLLTWLSSSLGLFLTVCSGENQCRDLNLAITLTVLQIIAFLIIAKGLITSKFIIYEELFNPILSDSFGFTVKETSYFFVLLLPAHIGVFTV